MKSDRIKAVIIVLIPIIGITFFLFYDRDKNMNQRDNPNQSSSTSAFQSRLKGESTEGLETLSTTLTELKTTVRQEGNTSNSREVKTGDEITVNYKGWLAKDGTVFDQSFNRGDSGFSFTVGSGVITGWSEGVIGMKEGEVRRLYIPSAKGYGASGAGSSIPANADLIFDVELISFDN